MKDVKHFSVLSKGKSKEALTFKWFREHGFKNFVTFISYGDNPKDYAGKVVVCPKSVDSLSKKIKYVVEYNKDWSVLITDNVFKVDGVIDELNLTRQGFSNEFTPEEVLRIVNKDIKKAAGLGAYFGGFASNSNFFFRQKKYRSVGFVYGRLFYMKKCGMNWNHSISKCDYFITAEALLYSGSVLINNYLFAHGKRFEAIGGDGDYNKRLPAMQKASKELQSTYRGLYKVVEGKDSAEVRMCFNSSKQVNQWRTTAFKN